MLYLIGLGLNVDGISKYGLDVLKKCKKIYLENYTVDFPYKTEGLKEFIGKKILPANREFVESLKIVDQAKKMDVALLVYGSPLTATTHISLIEEAKKSKVRNKVIHNASIFDAVAETGLQLYKFGKTTSIPNFKVDSFIETIKENQKINAHSLILTDIGLNLQDALKQLESATLNHNIKLKKIIVCSRLGAGRSRVFYKTPEELKDLEVEHPFCIIIPSKLHFVEKDFLESF